MPPQPQESNLFGEANPLLVRELRQSLRVTRLPWLIASATLIIGLSFILSGSMASQGNDSARFGAGMFSFYAMILVTYITLVGPATAAGTISQEREGRTLEPLLLTNLDSKDIVRGKFFASSATLLLHVMALLPLSAIPLFFGGVTGIELLALVVLTVLSILLSTSFGLSIAARTETMRNALALSVIVPALLLPVAAGFLMGAHQYIARGNWPAVDQTPSWWLHATAVAPLNTEYVLWLIVWPIWLFFSMIWGFLSSARMHLAPANDDRSTGPRVWFSVVLLVTSVLFIFSARHVAPRTLVELVLFCVAVLTGLAFIGSLQLATEPWVAGRVIKARWKRNKASWLTRAFGPGLMRGFFVQTFVITCVFAVFFSGIITINPQHFVRAITSRDGANLPAAFPPALGILLFGVWSFLLFLNGLAALLRTRKLMANTAATRIWLVATAALCTLIPLLITAITESSGITKKVHYFMAPSPVVAPVAYIQLMEFKSLADDMSFMSIFTSIFYTLLGLVFCAIAFDRARKQELRVAHAEASLQKTIDREEEEGVLADDDDEPSDSQPKVKASVGIDESKDHPS